MMLERRKHYPRVKVLGGLYSVRREPKDDSLVREVIKAVNDLPVSKDVSSDEGTYVESTQGKTGTRIYPPGRSTHLHSVVPN